MNLRPADYEDLGEDFFRAASGRKVTDFSGGAGHHSRNRTYAEPSGEWFPSLLAVSRRSVTGFRNRTPNLCRSPNLSYRRVVGFDGSVAGFWGGPLWNSEKIYGHSNCQVRRERGPMGGKSQMHPSHSTTRRQSFYCEALPLMSCVEFVRSVRLVGVNFSVSPVVNVCFPRSGHRV